MEGRHAGHPTVGELGLDVAHDHVAQSADEVVDHLVALDFVVG